MTSVLVAVSSIVMTGGCPGVFISISEVSFREDNLTQCRQATVGRQRPCHQPRSSVVNHRGLVSDRVSTRSGQCLSNGERASGIVCRRQGSEEGVGMEFVIRAGLHKAPCSEETPIGAATL